MSLHLVPLVLRLLKFDLLILGVSESDLSILGYPNTDPSRIENYYLLQILPLTLPHTHTNFFFHMTLPTVEAIRLVGFIDLEPDWSVFMYLESDWSILSTL